MDEQTVHGQPERSAGDVAHSAVRAGLSLIPFAGGAAVELFNLIIAPPLEKRRDEWINSIVGGLKILDEEFEAFSLEDLLIRRLNR